MAALEDHAPAGGSRLQRLQPRRHASGCERSGVTVQRAVPIQDEFRCRLRHAPRHEVAIPPAASCCPLLRKGRYSTIRSGRPLVSVLARVRAHWRTVRGLPAWYPTVLAERWRERAGGHPVDPDHEPHARAALEWIERAQDATSDHGVARGYSLV